MNNTRAAHSHPWKISDVVIFPLLLIGLAIEWLAPTALGIPRSLGITSGLLIAVGGFGLIHWSKKVLDASDQPSLPAEPTTMLVTSGPFRYSRNPNYLGAAIAVFGGAIAIDSLWLVATATLTVLILDRWMIGPEERYLSDVFGEGYAEYRQKTRRWF
ncbi:MAG: DUF1295 domain-containing protein [Boseongicola sp.]|nr:MAG: DUF1295 domain-containing protein [Boseongicola sp.]